MNLRRPLFLGFQAWAFVILVSALVGPFVVGSILFYTLQPSLTHFLDRRFDPKQAHLDDGNAKSDKGDYDGAIADYNEALKLDAQFTPAYRHRGDARAAQDDNDGAIADFSTVLALDPNDSAAYYDRGEAKAALGDNDGAIADYDHAIAIDPKDDDTDTYSMRGIADDAKGDHAGAMADLTHAIELDSKDSYCYFERGGVEEIHGDFSAALADYDQAIKLAPDDSDYPRLYRQLVLRRLGRPAEDFAKTVASWKDGWSKSLGRYLTGGLDEPALLTAAETKNLESVKGQQCEAYYFIGLTRRLNGDPAGARDFLQECTATEMKDYNEYKFARAELARMDHPESK